MDQLELSAIDYVYGTGGFPPMSFILHFAAELNPERIADAFRTTSQQFRGAAGVLAQRDAHTLYFDLTRDAAVIEICDEASAAPWMTQVQLVRTQLGEPLARARITRMAGGGTRISLVLSHGLGDGYSYFLFLAAWAARSRGEAGFEAACNRSALRPAQARPEPGRRWLGELPHSGFFIDAEDEVRELLPFVEGSLTSDAVKGQNGLSSNDLLSAAAWKKSVAPEYQGPTTFCTLSDLRRYRPDLGPLYFGNAILPVKVAVDADALRQASQVEVAEWIRSAVAAVPGRIDLGVLELETIRQSQGLSVFSRIRPTDRRGITVSNMSRAPYAALDFGAGVPFDIEPVRLQSVDPCMIVLPATTEAGGLRTVATRPRQQASAASPPTAAIW
jgi:hypothetical protein